ncbi:hypothetical protein CVS40_11771 [Lucilia cuprina]|nr:hypothetical protein CVS40_11771 [Lucilia cuprina]
MAPGPPDKYSNNKFYPLGDYVNNPTKKQKQNEFPDLPTPHINNKNQPKYVLISSTDSTKQLAKLSPFAIKKGVEDISTEYTSISLLRDGNLLILARNSRIADKFVRAKTLSNVCPVSCKLHDTLNSVKGVIYAPCLIHVPEKEIVEEMKDQGVTDVYKFTKPSEDGKSRIPTGKMIITFDLYRLPQSVDVAWYKCKVDHYFPNPMRCLNCQRLGHTQKRCRGDATCPECSLPPHDKEKCQRTFCTNCSGKHSSSDKNCPRYLQMKEILKIKTINYCSIGEARRKYRESNPIITASDNTYANITYETPTKRKEAKNNENKQKDQIFDITTPLNNRLPLDTPKTSKPKPTTTKKVENQKENCKSKENNDNKSNKTETAVSSNKNFGNENNALNSNNTFISPISSITQTLIRQNSYFLPSVNEESPDDPEMELSPL